MNNINPIRSIGGWASILSGIILFLAHLLISLTKSNNGSVLGSSLVLTAHLVVVFGLIGIYEVQATQLRFISVIGMLLSVVGTIFVSAIVFVELAGASGVEVDPIFNAPVVHTIYSIGPLYFVFGMILLGISTMISKLPSRMGGLFLILGTIVFALASFASSGKNIIEVIGAAITGGGYVWCGASLLKINFNSQSSTIKKASSVIGK
jgi:hypothetical protein